MLRDLNEKISMFLTEEMRSFGLEQIGKDIEELDSNAKFTYWPGSNDLQVDTTDGTFYIKEFEQGEDEYIVTVWQDDEHFQEVAVKMSNDSKHDAKQILKVGKQLIEVFGVESVNESLNERLEQKPFQIYTQGDDRPFTTLHAMDAQDARNLFLDQYPDTQINKIEEIPEDHEKVTEDFLALGKSSDGPDVSGTVTFIPGAYGYYYETGDKDLDDYDNLPKWTTIRTIDGIRIWFRNVLFAYGAEDVTIGKQHWNLTELKQAQHESAETIFNMDLLRIAVKKQNTYINTCKEADVEPKIMLFIVDRDRIVDTKLVERQDVYTYQPQDNEYYLDMVRDSGIWYQDYNLEPAQKLVDHWNKSKKQECLEGPAVFTNTTKFNSPQEYKAAIDKMIADGYKVHRQVEGNNLLVVVYDKNNNHIGTFNNTTQEYFHEALDVEDNGVEEATTTLTANGNKYPVRRTKQGMKNFIYNNVKYAGIFKDEYWQGYRSILDQIKDLGYEVVSGPTNDPHHNNGYSLDGNEKAWDIQIENPETHIQLRGQIKAQAAGTVEDPMSAYDMLLILY